MCATTSSREECIWQRPILDVPAEAVRQVWEAKDGTSVLLRAIEPDDFEMERDFVNGLSRSTCYNRLMSAGQPTIEEIRRWTDIDRQRQGAVVGVVQNDGRKRQIGVARYAMEAGRDDIAECVIVISDAWQRRGLGSQLLSSLIKLARQSGLKALNGSTLAVNVAMVTLARRSGFKVTYDTRSAVAKTLSLELPLA